MKVDLPHCNRKERRYITGQRARTWVCGDYEQPRRWFSVENFDQYGWEDRRRVCREDQG